MYLCGTALFMIYYYEESGRKEGMLDGIYKDAWAW